MKRFDITKKLNLKIIVAIILLSIVTATSFAIYKENIQGNISATAANVVLEIENQSSKLNQILDTENNTVEYFFKVKNYTTENENIILNQVEINYYLKIDDLDELINKNLIKVNLYYINEENEETEILKDTIGTFKEYYNPNQILGTTEQEERNFKLKITLISKIEEEKNLNFKIDLGYKQYIDEKNKNLEVANEPDLVNGMIPVIWDGINWVVVDSQSNDWYNYEEKKWANVILVSEENKAKYEGKAGTAIENADINCMYVWIPRFVYKINENYYHTKIEKNQEISEDIVDIHFSKTELEGGDFWDQSININTEKTADASNGKWTTSPVFTFEDKELNGIWVSKFQISNSSNTTTGYSNVDFYFRPGKNILTNVSIDNAFIICRNMELSNKYGLPLASGNLLENGTFENDNNGYDVHLIKNSEWSTICFLANSKYGQSRNEVESNPTAIAGGSNNYKNVFNINGKLSTTGNETGIYDLSGANWEHVAGYMGDTYANTKIPVIYKALSSYKDVYHVEGTDYKTQINVYNMFENFKCATIWETSSTGVNSYDTWFAGRSNIASGSNLVLARGKDNPSGTSSDTCSIYSFGYTAGEGATNRSFRAVLIVNKDL